MPVFISGEDLSRWSNDGAAVAAKADEFIDRLRAQADAAAITAEQTCSLLEHKFLSLSSEFDSLSTRNSELTALLDRRSAELARAQAETHQTRIQLIAKEGEVERSCAEASELQKSKRQITELLVQKDSEISEKNVLIKSYLDKIVNLTDTLSLKESRLSEVEADLARSKTSCSRLSQEKELVERHNVWLNDELTTKVKSLVELRTAYGELEADLSSKISDLERKLSESSSSLKWNKDNAMDLEKKLKSVQEELGTFRDTAAANEELHYAEMETVNKLVELYKESSQEWSRKAGELEGVIKAAEAHLGQVEIDYKERLEKEQSARKEIEKEAALLKEKLVKCEAEVETSRRARDMELLPWSTSGTDNWVDSVDENDMANDCQMVVPYVPSGVSGTALAVSLLRDGWSLVKMYTKYQEAVDALHHERLGRKQSQAILERVLYEVEEKAGVIMDERAEHERFVEAYSTMNQKLQHSLSEQNNLERTIRELKADLRKCERDNSIAHKEVIDLQKQVSFLLKECQDVQLCGSVCDGFTQDSLSSIVELNAETDADKVISGRLLAYKDIHGLVDQNVQLRSIVRRLSDQIESMELELKEKFEMELQNQDNEAAAKVNAVLARAEEQGQMIESLHTSVAMYKRLYEEEHRHQAPFPHTSATNQDGGQEKFMLLPEGSQEDKKKAQEDATERIRCLEDDLNKLRSEVRSLQSERDKLAKESEFARDKLDRNLKELEHQRDETNAVISRNVEFSQLIINYQHQLRESSESLQAAEECSRKSKMEVSVLQNQKEMVSNAEKRACDEIRSLSERVYRLQASLESIHSAEEAREEAIRAERRKQDDYVKQIQNEWVLAKKELDEERGKVQQLTLDREEIRKSSFIQIEEMRKNLSTLSNALTAAEARAAAAEKMGDMAATSLSIQQLSDKVQSVFREKIKSSGTLIAGRDNEHEVSSTHTNEALTDLHIAREEIDNLKKEAQINKAHMVQYKSIAQVNEEALKQMELAHENFKVEADKVRMSLEAELVLMKQQFHDLECEFNLKFKEAASCSAARESDLNSALSEIEHLKQGKSVMMSQITVLEVQVSSLKDDLDKEHKRRRDAQTNYERQVILQSETIQELTRTSEALALLQEDISELRKLSDALKSENSELKSKWDCERSMLEEAKNVAEKKYDEINEQNKILHSRLEALHIKLAEKHRDYAGISSGRTDQTLPDAGLQNVVNYLRGSKEIAETEISLLKQEKLRMQSQLESSLKAAESAQASLQAVRANPRAMLFTEDEFKSLQLQVREVNLLRESNIQLREENKHNFEECQKLREVARKARMETEQLESLLTEKHVELEASKKECQMLSLEKDRLEKKVEELLERCRNNIDVEDYHLLRTDVTQMQSNLSEKDIQLAEVKKILYEKDEVISQLEKDLAKSRKDLSEREGKLNETSQVVASLTSEIENQKKYMAKVKGIQKKLDVLVKEKEELQKQNDALCKQAEDWKQGRKSVGGAAGDHVMKEKEKEKDTRTQILEKTVERQREELKKERDDLKTEKAKRQKTERAIMETIKSVNQDKNKLVDGLQKHKQARERLADEVERVKHAKDSLPEGTSVVQILSGDLLDHLSAAYQLAVDNFERVAHSICDELGVPSTVDISSVDASPSVVTSGQALTSQAPLVASSINTSSSPAKTVEEPGKKFVLPTTHVEPRKMKRILLRSRPKKTDNPPVDSEKPEAEQSNVDEKPFSSHNFETKDAPSQLTHTFVRKRLAPPTSSEPRDESVVQRGASSDVEAPPPKKTKGSDSPHETVIEGNETAISDNLETVPPSTQESSDVMGDRPQTPNEDLMDTEKDDGETGGEQDEDQKLDTTTNQPDLQSNDILEEFEDQVEDELQQSAIESESEREEGEVLPDTGDIGDELVEDQTEPIVPLVSSPLVDDDILDPTETNASQALIEEADLTEANEDESADNSNAGNNNNNNQIETDAETVAITTGEPKNEGDENPDLRERSLGDGAVEGGSSSSSSVAQETQVREVSPVNRTINLHERAKQRSALRQQQLQQQGRGSTPPPARGRGRIPRGRGGRGPSSRGGRG